MNTSNYDLEDNIISCILQNNHLINELYVDDIAFQNQTNRNIINFFKKFYKEHKNLDVVLMTSSLKETQQANFINYISSKFDLPAFPALFYEYQESLVEKFKTKQIEDLIDNYKNSKIQKDTLVEKILEIQNKELLISNNYKKITPEEMLKMVRNKEKNLSFSRLWKLNSKLKLKKHTVNVIAARPSEGKSALALNLFLDLSRKYKTIFFNLEMTEEEVYERMLGIEADLPINLIIDPTTEIQNERASKAAKQIYNLNYELVNGSKSLKSIRNKIIKEQREEHLIVFIDYVGYVKNKSNQNDKERIGEVVREFNDITKDYNCTIFFLLQINRNGADKPTMQDLKDSGELEQTADTLILIHDQHPEINTPSKQIDLVLAKCRGSKRGVAIMAEYDKERQKMDIK